MEIYSPLRAGQQGSAGPGSKRKARVVVLPSFTVFAKILCSHMAYNARIPLSITAEIIVRKMVQVYTF
jgi:hypothetical protein